MKSTLDLPASRTRPIMQGLGRIQNVLSDTAGRLIEQPRALLRPRTTRPTELRPVALALQGGAAYGAFTWGVLDRLAAEPSLQIDMISGASAGAVNAVLFASGYAEDGPTGAQRRLRNFWNAVGKPQGNGPFNLPMTGRTTMALFEASAQFASPYQLNPLGLNPLRKLLEAEVDFERLRKDSPIRLMIATTRVRDGALRLFSNRELSVETVLASACLPKFHHAVEIEGEAYWDGGFAANPPLRQLAIDTLAADIVLVQIMPREVARLPQSAIDISKRTTMIAFNAAFDRELEALGHLQASCAGILPAVSPDRRRLRQLRLHRISAVNPQDGLSGENMLDTRPVFLNELHSRGLAAADNWLETRVH